MSHSITTLMLSVVSLFALGLGACTSAQQWSPSGGSRESGVVRLSYEYPEYQQPQVSDAQAAKLAMSRCNSWGYSHAESIEGQIRRCANMDDGNCDLWQVTREYQCRGGEASYASRLSR